MPEEREMEFGAEAVRRLRLSLECSQEEFAKIMGVTVATLSRWETGKAAPRGRNESLFAFLRQRLESGVSPITLKKVLLLGGALLAAGTSPVALLQSGFLTEEALLRATKTLFEKEGDTR